MSSSDDVEITSVIDGNGQPLPLQGNSIGTSLGPAVNQERPDEAEICKLAAKLKDKHMLLAAQQPSRREVMRQASGAGGAGGGASGAITTPPSRKPSDGESGDEASIKGHFGWAQFDEILIPYIFRQSEKYCSVRMIELKLLNKYLQCLHPDIYTSCTCMRSYFITDVEERLFVEINQQHCDGELDCDIFKKKDLLVRLSDASELYKFLEICYRKLVSGSTTPWEKCGFIRINKVSVIPYMMCNNQLLLPLFSFEGEVENLKEKVKLLKGWDLAYLKFCCKVQGIRNELFSSDNVAVICLSDIISHFPNGTEFEDYWPTKVNGSNLLIGNKPNARNSAGSVNSQSTQSTAGNAASAAMLQTGKNIMMTHAMMQALSNSGWVHTQNNVPPLIAQRFEIAVRKLESLEFQHWRVKPQD